MEDAEALRYWCHMCSQRVNPITEMETIKCSICQSGFVEEIPSAAPTTPPNDRPLEFGSDSGRALSLWAPILLGMIGVPTNHPQLRRMQFLDNGEEHDNEHNHRPNDHVVESSMTTNAEEAERERRCNSAATQEHQGRNAISVEGDNDRDAGRRVILINPFNQTIIIQGSNGSHNELYNRGPIGLLGDYFMGLGLDLLLQHFAENDPNRQGTPPAKKEAVDALPVVKVEEAMKCCVCLDECEVGTEMKEMPCKHKFHSSCIVPWLELHSSCPVCRYQLPVDDEFKLDPEVSRNSSTQEGGHNNEDSRNANGRRFSIPLEWPFSLFLSNASQTSGGNESSSLASASTSAPQTTSRADEN